MNNVDELMRVICIYALPVLLAITLHEAAHAWAARRLGDATAFMLGRVSLNPIRHIDPLGTVLLPLFFVLSHSGFFMGWAKPVPVNAGSFSRPQRDLALVALAGPVANCVMAIIWGWLGVLAGQNWIGAFCIPLSEMSAAGVSFNVCLMIFNLLPIPPLDGGKIMAGFLPRNLAQSYAGLERYGLMIVAVLIATRILNGPLSLLYGLGDQFVHLFY